MGAAEVEQVAGALGHRHPPHRLRRGEPRQRQHTALIEPPLLIRHARVEVERPTVQDVVVETGHPIPLQEAEEDAVAQRLRACRQQPPPGQRRQVIDIALGPQVAGARQGVEQLGGRLRVGAAAPRQLRRAERPARQLFEEVVLRRHHHRPRQEQRRVGGEKRRRRQPQRQHRPLRQVVGDDADLHGYEPSARILFAASRPGAAITPPPGWVPEPHM